MHIALVLWSGLVGGAETFSAALARELLKQGVGAGVVFVGEPEPLARSLRAADVPYATLGIDRGRRVVGHSRRLAQAARSFGADGAVVVEPGLLAAALRLGGYRERIVAVNHGALLHRERPSVARRLKQWSSEAAGFWAADVEVAVSDAVLRAIRHRLHARSVVRIYNGVDLSVFTPRPNGRVDAPVTIGAAGRLIAGKGLEDLIAAFALQRENRASRLRIAGHGPLRQRLEQLAAAAGVADRVVFDDTVHDIATFWQSCAVAAMPSNEWVESFGMSAAEAMACGVPVVASRNGALPEVVEDGRAGMLFARGDVKALSRALSAYLDDDELRQAHGAEARRVCEERFDIRDCASRYRSLFDTKPA